ncbi:MAG TPA: phage tail protein, partial [Burkholderiales bacterium]|nr:phage tail protein [Burkholderiales bacterium]
MLASIPNGAKRVLTRALNRAIAGAKTDAIEQITATYTIKATTVRDSLTLKKANFNILNASLKADGRVIPLTKFKITEGKITQDGKSRPIIRTTIKHGETKTLKHGFLATMATGHRGVFLRTGKERLPIKQVFSLSIPQMLGNKDIKKYLEDNAHDR